MSRPLLTIIAGPTASGKTGLAVAVAQRLGAEVVSADSQQVYRGFDIGTAKPSPEELAAVRHHLISSAEPTQRSSAATFLRQADAAIADIVSRNKRVVVVGGTGLYLRVLLHGVVEVPEGSPALRAELEALANREGDEALHFRLAQADPETAARLPRADRVRIIRALEIFALTGKRASEHRSAHAFSSARYPYRMWVLDPARAVLYAAIDERTRRMFASGLLEETAALVQRGLKTAAPMGSVGYAQALACLEGRLSQAEAIADAAMKTRRYAKRQWTWFRKEPGARFISPPYDVEAIVAETLAAEGR